MQKFTLKRQLSSEETSVIGQFYARCKALNLRPASIAQYRKVLIRFASNNSLTECSTSDIRKYLADMQVSNTTKKIHWQCLKVFYDFLERNKLMEYNPITAAEKPRVAQKRMRYFSDIEIRQMLDCWDKTTYSGIRNYMIMVLFLATGMRRAELANLTLNDIRWDLNAIIIKDGKGGKQREIPLSARLRRELVSYIKRRNEWLHGHYDCKRLFLSVQYRQGLTPAGVWAVFSKSGLTGERISPHTWRHTFARQYLLNGGDLVTLQLILGHSDISTTRKYISLANDDLQIAFERFNPLKNY